MAPETLDRITALLQECIDGVPEPTIAQDGMVIAPTQPSRVQYKRKSK